MIWHSKEEKPKADPRRIYHANGYTEFSSDLILKFYDKHDGNIMYYKVGYLNLTKDIWFNASPYETELEEENFEWAYIEE